MDNEKESHIQSEIHRSLLFNYYEHCRETYRQTKKAERKNNLLYYEAQDFFVRSASHKFPIQNCNQQSLKSALKNAFEYIETLRVKTRKYSYWELEEFLCAKVYKNVQGLIPEN